MYITKSGVIQKIDEDAWPSWRDDGWAIDQDRDGTPDSLSGGDTSGLLPIADPTGVTIETVANPVTGSGTINVATFPADTVALAIKIEGDVYARLLMLSDPATDGIYFGDGTYDPYGDGGPFISLAGATNKGLNLHADEGVQFNSDAIFSGGHGPTVHDTDDGHTYRFVSTNGVPTLVEVT